MSNEGIKEVINEYLRIKDFTANPQKFFISLSEVKSHLPDNVTTLQIMEAYLEYIKDNEDTIENFEIEE